MLLEEWNDAFIQLLSLPHSIGHSVAVVLANHATPEVGLDRVEELRIAFVLDDGELGQDLNSHRHALMSSDSDMEAAFTIHEACDPFRVEIHGHPELVVSEGSLVSQGLPCGLSPCPPDFDCSRIANEYWSAVRGVSRI